MISQFFVLSQRGDHIVFRDYRGEVPKGSAEIFFRKVKFWNDDEAEEAPPVFNVDGVNYIHVKVAGLFFVVTTMVNVSPSLLLELLQRIARVTKDYLGVLNEDSLRKNFIWCMNCSTKSFKAQSGYILTSEIDGTIQMKSYLTGNPEIRLALNEDLSIGRTGSSSYDYRSSSGGGAVILDDCNFHESVHLDSFDIDRTLTLIPPDGEFAVMNYRMTQEFKPPFRVTALIEEAGPSRVQNACLAISH
ncbi:hypothetical protein HU200_005179 [Digitaria exilis]|uniref:MHD domain-containing protein n=1 Tax=Digitaria exilis TaxID=1010633 RepID=A0A835KUG3_9POAL|nr:hypothetical protein HU200_005179 [Digitaria exilis]